MKHRLILGLLCLLSVVLPSTLLAQISDGMNASNIIGQINDTGVLQPAYTKNGTYDSPNGMGFNNPAGITVDAAGHRLFVSDYNGNRVLVYNLGNDNRVTDYKADYVLGQPDFTSIEAATTQAGMFGPTGVLYDAAHSSLFVADTGNSRVLVFSVGTITNGQNASHVIGKSDFSYGDAGTSETEMSNPFGLALDSSGNRLFVGDTSNNRVLVFDITSISDGEAAVHVLGQVDFSTADMNYDSDSPGTTGAHGFHAPMGLAYYTQSSSKILAVADDGNHRVMLFDVSSVSDGMAASNVLGQTDFSGSDYNATQSKMRNPRAVTYDSVNQRLGVSDSSNHRILIFDVSSVSDGKNASYVIGQTTFISRVTAASQGGLNTPIGVVFLPADNLLYVTDYSNNRVMEYSTATLENGLAAQGSLGETTSFASPSALYTKNGIFNSPNDRGFGGVSSVAVDAVHHRLFVSDASGNRVLVFNLNNDNTLADYNADYVLGQSDFSSVAQATTQGGMYMPRGVAYDSVGNRLFVADMYNNRVLVFDVATITNGENAVNVLGQVNFTSSDNALTQAGMYRPLALAYDSTNGKLFVADYSNNRILMFDLSVSISDGQAASKVLGQPDFETSSWAVSQSKLAYPLGIAIDATHNRLFVGDNNSNRVLVFDVASIENGENAANVLGQDDFVSSGYATNQKSLSAPMGVAYDSVNDRLFVADQGNKRVMIFDVDSLTNGENAINVLGQTDFTENTGGTTQSKVSMLDGLAVDASSQQLYVADMQDNRVLVFNVDPSTPPTATPTVTSTPTATATNTPTATSTPTNTPISTATPTTTPTSVATNTPDPLVTSTPVPTIEPTSAATPIATSTPGANPTATPAPTPENGTIIGWVVDSNGNPIAGAVVFCEGLGSVVTDNDGRYVFAGAKADTTYNITVTATAYTFPSRHVSVSTGSESSGVAPEVRAEGSSNIPTACSVKYYSDKLASMVEDSRLMLNQGESIAQRLRSIMDKTARKELQHRLNIMTGAYKQNLRSAESLASLSMTCPRSYVCVKTKHSRALDNSKKDYWHLSANTNILGRDLANRQASQKKWAQKQLNRSRSLYRKALKTIGSYPSSTNFCGAQ